MLRPIDDTVEVSQVNDRLCDGRLNGPAIEQRETRQMWVKYKNESFKAQVRASLNSTLNPQNLSSHYQGKIKCRYTGARYA